MTRTMTDTHLGGYLEAESAHPAGVELFRILLDSAMRLILSAREGPADDERERLQGKTDYARQALATNKKGAPQYRQ